MGSLLADVLSFLIIPIAAFLILYAPGWLIVSIARLPGDALERHYARVLVSVLLSGWLALLLATAGIFWLWLYLGLLLLICGALALVAYRIGLFARSTTHASPSPGHWWRLAIWGVVGLIALVLVLPPFETVLGARDTGVYSNTGFAIARTGSLVQYHPIIQSLAIAAESPDPAVRDPAIHALSHFLGVQNRERFIATRMQTAGFFIHEGDLLRGRIVPQHLHLSSIWIGIGASIGGAFAGLFAPGLMGLLGAWSVGMLGRILANERVGIIAFLLLSLNSVHVWFARSSTSETTAQFLIFACLYCFAKMVTLTPPAHLPITASHPSIWYGIFAGVAAGQLALNRIDFVLVIIPLIAYLLICFIMHRWRASHSALALALALMLLHAGLHMLFIARAYVFDTAFARIQDFAITSYLAQPFLTPVLREVYHTTDRSPFKDPMRIWRELAVLAAIIIVVIGLWHWPYPLMVMAQWLQHWRRWLARGIAIGVLLLTGYGYLVRPQILIQMHQPDRYAPYIHALETFSHELAAEFARQDAQIDQDGSPLLRDIVQGNYSGKAFLLRQRLMKNIELTQRSEQNRAALDDERATLLAELDHLTRTILDRPFDAFIPAQQDEHDTAQTLLFGRFDLSRIWAIPPCSHPEQWAHPDDVCRTLQSYVGAPVPLPPPPTGLDEKYMIPLANFVRFGWYLSPLGVLLGTIGLAYWCWRGLNRASWLFLFIGLLGTFFYIRDTYGTSDQSYIYILRRFVPVGYPTFSLGIAYALMMPSHIRWAWVWEPLRWGSVAMLAAFFLWTGQPIYRHVEYAGAVSQLTDLGQQFDDDTIILARGGAPLYQMARDVPDLVVTPLAFGLGIHAFSVKSHYPAAYADALAAQIRQWNAEGHPVALIISASGGDIVVPGFAIEPAGHWVLDVPEFEQLTNQKPHNVGRLRLPFTIYHLRDGVPGQMPTLSLPLGPTDTAAQLRGIYLAEEAADGQFYAWTNGDALLRIPWHEDEHPSTLTFVASGGQRPAHLGDAQVCLSLMPEQQLWVGAGNDESFIALGCFTVSDTPMPYTISLPDSLPSSALGSALLRIESEPWIPAREDPQQHDRRMVGVQWFRLGQP